MVLWDTSPPSSRSAGFPNKVAIPYPNTSSLDLSACRVASGMSLDSVTRGRGKGRFLESLYNSGPQPFGHQGPVSWKTIFPRRWGGGRNGSGSNPSDGSSGNASDGQRWATADEASLTPLPLTSCCAARLLTGGWGPLLYRNNCRVQTPSLSPTFQFSPQLRH